MENSPFCIKINTLMVMLLSTDVKKFHSKHSNIVIVSTILIQPFQIRIMFTFLYTLSRAMYIANDYTAPS